MPSIYTHDAFGRHMMEKLPGKLKMIAQSHEALYRFGHQGPDFLFFYTPYLPTVVQRTGSYIHRQACFDFLELTTSGFKKNLTDEEIAYLTGFIGHFILDTLLHPVIEASEFNHFALETELDRYYIHKDGFNKMKFPVERLIPPTDLIADTVNEFYVNYKYLNSKRVEKSIDSFRRTKKFLVLDEPYKEFLIPTVMSLPGINYFKDILSLNKDRKFADRTNPVLSKKVQAAKEPYLRLLRNFFDEYGKSNDFLPFFKRNFNGIIHTSDE